MKGKAVQPPLAAAWREPMNTKRLIPILAIVVILLNVISSSAGTLTVAKNGSGMFTGIQAAINAAGPGDVVKILDAATYPEQVTINGTKNGLTLTSSDPTSLSKPKIIWKDEANKGPQTCAEAQIDSLVTFEQNGALRLMRARGVIINGITVDGGGPLAFGSGPVWPSATGGPCYFPNFHGNVAILLWRSGDVIVRNCEAQNAYFGIYLNDRNEGGIFGQSCPGDCPNRYNIEGFGFTGNHVVEYNRVHYNSYGIFVEAAWDLGSTIRYNLIYENHHQTDLFAASVKALNSEGGNQPGGAIFFKDNELSQLAIYNNTFWHNFYIFVGTWQAGYQHLIFNNIFAKPFKYWSADPTFSMDAYMDLDASMPNRIYNCLYAAQNNKPQGANGLISTVSIMSGFPSLSSDSSSPSVAPGTLLANPSGTAPFPATANNRWLEMDAGRFLSTDPASKNFLTPDWNDTLVRKYVKNQGWQKSGVKNLDGTWADLGAIPSSGGMALNLTTLPPAMPVMIVPGAGNTATIRFTVMPRIGTMNNPVFKFFRWVGNLRFVSNAYASMTSAMVISNANINDVAIPATPVQPGVNTFTVTLPAAQTTPYGFFEAVIEGTGSDGRAYTTSTGFLPYSSHVYPIKVQVFRNSSAPNAPQLTTATAGDTVAVRLTPIKNDNTEYQKPLNFGLSLVSGYELSSPRILSDTIPKSITGSTALLLQITKANVINYLRAAGTAWFTESTSVDLQSFFGISDGIRILPGPPARVLLQDPHSKSASGMPLTLSPGQSYQGRLSITDRFGNRVNKPEIVYLESLTPAIGDVVEGEHIIPTDSSGAGIFKIHVPGTAAIGATFSFQAILSIIGECDTAIIKVGPASAAIRQPNDPARPRVQVATVNCFDLRGRLMFRKTFEPASPVSLLARNLLGRPSGLGTQVYMMEIVVKDAATQKQTRSLRKMVSR